MSLCVHLRSRIKTQRANTCDPGLGRAPRGGSFQRHCSAVNHPTSPTPSQAILSLADFHQAEASERTYHNSLDPQTPHTPLPSDALHLIFFPALAFALTTPRSHELGHAMTLDLCRCSDHHLRMLGKSALPMCPEGLSSGIVFPDAKSPQSSQMFSASLDFCPTLVDVAVSFVIWSMDTGCWVSLGLSVNLTEPHVFSRLDWRYCCRGPGIQSMLTDPVESKQLKNRTGY